MRVDSVPGQRPVWTGTVSVTAMRTCGWGAAQRSPGPGVTALPLASQLCDLSPSRTCMATWSVAKVSAAMCRGTGQLPCGSRMEDTLPHSAVDLPLTCRVLGHSWLWACPASCGRLLLRPACCGHVVLARPSWGVSVPVTFSSPGTLACGVSGTLGIRSPAEGVTTAALDSLDGVWGGAAGPDVEGELHPWLQSLVAEATGGKLGSRGVWGGATDPARPRPL